MQKIELEIIQALRHRASRIGQPGRPTDVLWQDIAATRGLE